MCKAIEIFSKFKENEKDTWLNRFTWGGLNGKYPKHTTSIVRFFDENKCLEDIEKVNNVNEFFKQVELLASHYVVWVNSKGTKYNKAENDDMRNFFVGAIGEFFFVELLNEVKCLMIPDPSSDDFNRYDFHYVSPCLRGDKDFGVDLVGVANDIPAVFQVKWWNPFSKTPISIDLFQKADSVGSRNGLIKQDDDNNIFLCWLGTEERADICVKANKDFKNKVVIIGARTLEASVNDRNKIFWENLYKKLQFICVV